MSSSGGDRRAGAHGIVAGVLLWGLVAPAVLADHVPGATYTGQTSTGGSVSLTLTPDGSGIASFSVKQIRSQNCPNTTLSLEQTSYLPAGLMPIQDHRFGKTSDGSTFEGAFPSAQRAEGTVRWSSSSGRDAGGRPCETGPLTWAATTDAQAATTPLAPFCEGTATPTFEDQLALLAARLGATMGEPAECAHVDASSGDTVQATTTGLAYVRAVTSTPTFTDGAHRWALTPAGLVTWDGEALDPPADATAVADPSAAQPTAVVLAPPPAAPQSGPAVVVTPPAGARNTAPPQQPAAPQPTAVVVAPPAARAGPPTGPAPAVAGSYAGEWAGSTDRGHTLTFTVRGSALFEMKVGLSGVFGSCQVVEGPSSTWYQNGPVITNGTFTAQVSDTTVTGRFTSATTAEGTVRYALTGPCGAPPFTVNWSATRAG